MAFPPDNQVKNLVADIVKNVPIINDDLAEFFIRLTSLNPTLAKCFTKSGTKEQEARLVEYCVEKLSDDNDPAILMMSMQQSYEKEYDTLENMTLKYRQGIEKRTEALTREIFQVKPGTKEDYERLLRRISIVLILKSGLGNPSNIQVLREGTSALNSVFNIDDLKTFVEKNENFKERQLAELLSVVSGIRIFNKDCGKGGESLPELATNLSEAAETTGMALSHCLVRIMERVNLLTSAIDASLVMDADSKSIMILIDDDKNIGVDEYGRVCKILALYRQYEILVRRLINDMDSLQVDNKQVCLDFSAHMFDLHALVRYRTAIPVDQVFPYFVKLWRYWRRMQDNMHLISAINGVMWNLDTIHEKLEVPHKTIDALLDGRRIISDAQRLQGLDDVKIDQTSIKCQVVFLSEKIFGEFSYQYLGFCSLCICTGTLIPANPNIGMLKWGKKFFAFCCPEHGKLFGLNPNRFIKETLEYLRNNVEMIQFLQVYEDLYAVRHMIHLIMKNTEICKNDDKEVQTELHPIPTYIDKDYIWNIWDYKRKALQMADIVNKRTHSTQTHCSASKKDAGCQTLHKV